MAWRKLGVAYAAMAGAYPQSLVDSAFTHAFVHRDRLTRREREMTTASYYMLGPGHDRARAADAYRQMLASGDSDIALNNYGIVLTSQRRYAAAESVLTATAHFPVTARIGLDNLVIVETDSGDLSAARRLLADGIRKPDSPAAAGSLLITQMFLDEITGDIPAVIRALDSLVAHGDMLTRGQAMLNLPLVSVLRGRPAKRCRGWPRSIRSPRRSAFRPTRFKKRNSSLR